MEANALKFRADINEANSDLKKSISKLRSLGFKDRNIIQRVLTTIADLDLEDLKI